MITCTSVRPSPVDGARRAHVCSWQASFREALRGGRGVGASLGIGMLEAEVVGQRVGGRGGVLPSSSAVSEALAAKEAAASREWARLYGKRLALSRTILI